MCVDFLELARLLGRDKDLNKTEMRMFRVQSDRCRGAKRKSGEGGLVLQLDCLSSAGPRQERGLEHGGTSLDRGTVRHKDGVVLRE